MWVVGRERCGRRSQLKLFCRDKRGGFHWRGKSHKDSSLLWSRLSSLLVDPLRMTFLTQTETHRRQARRQSTPNSCAFATACVRLLTPSLP